MLSRLKILLVASFFIAPPAFAQSSGYNVIPIDLSDETAVHGLNEAAELVGQAGNMVNPHAFLLTPIGETPIQLGEHPDETQVFGVNNQHKMVGLHQGTGFYLDEKGGVTFLTHPQADPCCWANTIPFGLINRGKTDTLIVGSFLNNHTETGFLLLRGKSWKRIGPPGALWARAYGVSGKNGVMVSGWYYDQAWQSHAFLYNLGKNSYTTLDVPGACGTAGRGMNDHGHVVGNYVDCTTGQDHGFVWDGEEYWAVTVPFPDVIHTYPHDINNAGQVTGTFLEGAPEWSFARGFLADPLAPTVASR